MGKFADFQKRKEEAQKRKPREETVFGQHSKFNVRTRKPREETVFGQHSQAKLRMRLEEGRPDPNSPILKRVQEIKLGEEDHDMEHAKAKPSRPLTDAHKEALQDYTDESKDQNSALIHYDNGHDISKQKKDQIKKTDAALEGHKTVKPMVVYTGVKRSPARHFEEGDTAVEVHHPSYISTSTCFHIAKGFSENMKHENNAKMGVETDKNDEARHVLKLHMPKGTNALSVRNQSFLGKEHEVLLARGHDFTIHHKPTIHVDKDGTKYHVWTAHVTGHAPANLDAEDL